MLRGFPSFWVPEARYERRWDLHASWIGSWPCQPDTGGQDAWSASVRVQTRDWKRFQDNRMSWSLAILTKSGPALRWHGQCRLDQVLFKTSNEVKCEFRKHLGFHEEDTVIFRYSRKWQFSECLFLGLQLLHFERYAHKCIDCRRLIHAQAHRLPQNRCLHPLEALMSAVVMNMTAKIKVFPTGYWVSFPNSIGLLSSNALLSIESTIRFIKCRLGQFLMKSPWKMSGTLWTGVFLRLPPQQLSPGSQV